MGGAPGGITFGARHVFGDNVYCFFAEPAEAPCVLLGLMTGKGADASVYDFGLELDTDADGLAVSKPSELVCGLMRPLVAGCYTVTDDVMYRRLLDMYETVGLEVEPSSAAGCCGPEYLLGTGVGKEFCQAHGIGDTVRNGTHIIWTTGGSLVPPAMHDDWRAKAAVG